MAVRLKTNDDGIPVGNMRDGQIGVITQWPIGDYVGRIVMRSCNDLITIGKPGRQNWTSYFSNPHDNHNTRVRILTNGETLIIEDNE